MAQFAKDSILVKMKVKSKVSENCYFTADRGSHIQNYHLSLHKQKNQIVFPYRKNIIFNNDADMAEINLLPLYQYPNHNHILHILPYRTKKGKDSGRATEEYQIMVSFIQIDFQNTKEKNRCFNIFFLNADITHDTEVLGKMKTYLKVKVNDKPIWTSKVNGKEKKKPNYNEGTDIKFNTFQDKVTVEIWDKDMVNDDFVGSFWVYVFELLAGIGEQCFQNILFEQKFAGIVRYKITSNLKIR